MPDGQAGFNREISHGYALLNDLTKQNKDVDKILFFKKVSDPSKTLLGDIADHCADVANWTSEVARSDKSISLGSLGLPPVETAARDAISSDKARELMAAGESFELDILLTQTESMQYGQYLARVLGDVEKDKTRVEVLRRFAEKFGEMRKRAADRLTIAQAGTKASDTADK